MRNWIRTGQIVAVRTPGKHVRIHRDEFEWFLQQHGMAAHPAEHDETRILLVEDEPEMLDLLADLLRGDPRGFKVETAADGYDALIKVGAFRPSVLVLDIVMPRLDGIEVCRRLRALPQTRAIRILGITGHEEAAPSLLAAGGDACLTKPFDATRFMQELDRLLGSGEGIGATPDGIATATGMEAARAVDFPWDGP